MDHALSVEFLGTKGVTPRADNKNVSSNKVNKALPLDKVRYENLWEGISLTYEATKEGISESTYHVAPGADITKIRLKYNVPVQLQKDGTLRFKFEKGYMTESAPVAWQEIKGKRIPVKVSFRENKGEIGFRAEKYDARYQLVIDPVYSWHTFYGNSSIDWTNAIAVDGSGNIYVTGQGGATWGTPLNAYSGFFDIVVLKMSQTQSFTVTAKAKGSGAGSVVSTPAGIKYNYPKTRKDPGLFKEGSTVIIKAKAKAGSKASWNKTCLKAGGKETGNNTRKAVCTIKKLKKGGSDYSHIQEITGLFNISYPATGPSPARDFLTT
jgi:hypothetical protein